MDFKERKQKRKQHFEKYVNGWKLRDCTACSGSGYYDNYIGGRVPKCSSCGGSGKERYKSESKSEIRIKKIDSILKS